MKIHILPSIGTSLLRKALEEQIKEAGLEVDCGIACADYVIGLVDSPEWHQVQDSHRKIILKERSKIDTVPENAVLVDVLMLTMIESPQIPLGEWLRSAPDLKPVPTKPTEIEDGTKIAKLETGLFYLNEHIKVLENWAKRGDMSISAMESLMLLREQFDRVANVLPPKRPE